MLKTFNTNFGQSSFPVGQIIFLTSLVLLITAANVLATAPAPTPPEQTPAKLHLWLEGGPDVMRDMPEPLGPFNYLRELDQIVGFLAVWQELDPDSPEYGGMIEAESGELGDLIQTDNTLEAIWCWSRYRELTGRDTYDANVAAAWTYCLNYPAWTEEGDPGVDYYRVHNCAWGLTAVHQYAAATGDSSYTGYAASCYDYIRVRPLDLINGDAYTRRLNAFVKGWAAGNLYLYSEAMGYAGMMAIAVSQGNDVLDWLNTDPSWFLGFEYWAMSSGTAVWGVCNSVFRDDPAAGQDWLLANAQYLDLWQDYYNVPGYDWDSAWNVAYAYAHFAIWDLLGDQDYWQNGKTITDALLSLDTDDDGGIMAETVDHDDEDMCWVTSYLLKFGVDRLLGTPANHDTGVLRFVGLEDGQYFDPGQPIAVRVLATNFGLDDENGVVIRLSGTAGDNTWTHDLPFAVMDTLNHDLGWLPTVPGYHTLTAWTELSGDEMAANDTISITIQVGDVTTIDAPLSGELICSQPQPNPFTGRVQFGVNLRQAGPVRLEVFDLRGRRVAELNSDAVAAGAQRLEWNGRDTSGSKLSAGTYLYRLTSGTTSSSGKLLKVR